MIRAAINFCHPQGTYVFDLTTEASGSTDIKRQHEADTIKEDAKNSAMLKLIDAQHAGALKGKLQQLGPCLPLQSLMAQEYLCSRWVNSSVCPGRYRQGVACHAGATCVGRAGKFVSRAGPASTCSGARRPARRVLQASTGWRVKTRAWGARFAPDPAQGAHVRWQRPGGVIMGVDTLGLWD
jgi:hypothetical protein